MALINCDFFSETLKISTSMSVILPQETHNQIGLQGACDNKSTPVLYLLHGLSDDNTAWIRRTSIERYAAKFGFAVIMPNVHRSFYLNMEHGGAYWDFINEELPELVNNFFNLSSEQDDTFIAGLSMGGYGAFKSAFISPEKFAACASLSGSMDVANRTKSIMDIEECTNIFGSKDKKTYDLFTIIKDLKDSQKKIPQIFQCCGTEDFLYDDNIKMKEFLTQLRIPFTYQEEQGEHTWDYWDKKIVDVLRWMRKIHKYNGDNNE